MQLPLQDARKCMGTNIPRVPLRLPWAMELLGFTFPLRAGDRWFSPSLAHFANQKKMLKLFLHVTKCKP